MNRSDASRKIKAPRGSALHCAKVFCMIKVLRGHRAELCRAGSSNKWGRAWRVSISGHRCWLSQIPSMAPFYEYRQSRGLPT